MASLHFLFYPMPWLWHWFVSALQKVYGMFGRTGRLRHGLVRLRAALLALAIRLLLRGQPRRYWRVAAKGLAGETVAIYRAQAKPEWVKREVLRLKALMPHTGCRKIADIFNRKYGASRKTTVGKTYVSTTIRKHLYEIQVLRKQIKNAKPKPVAHNLVWALDLTGKTTLDGRTHMILGIIEHASRAALTLEALHSKSSWTLVGKLVDSIKRYGKPKMIRTDNEAIFTSRVFRLALFLLGIRHQLSDLHCPQVEEPF